MKTLIILYSRTNNTKKVAEAIQNKLSCDIEEVIPETNYSGKIGYVRGGKDSAIGKKIKIEKPNYNPEDYDCIILATPIWAGTMSSPILAYINENVNKFKNVMFVATSKSDDGEKTFNKMSKIIGKEPLETLMVKESELNNLDSKISSIIDKIEKN